MSAVPEAPAKAICGQAFMYWCACSRVCLRASVCFHTSELAGVLCGRGEAGWPTITYRRRASMQLHVFAIEHSYCSNQMHTAPLVRQRTCETIFFSCSSDTPPEGAFMTRSGCRNV